MIKLFFLIFFISHLLGDFFFQSEKLAQKKSEKYKFLLLHSLLYLAIIVICILPFWSLPLFFATIILAASHYIIDNLKFALSKKYGDHKTLYFIDQLLHITCIFIASICLAQAGYDVNVLPVITEALTPVIPDYEAMLMWIGLTLLLIKPANITIMQFTRKYRPMKANTEGSDSVDEDVSINNDNAGALIGSLERLLIALLISVGQYAAIGLVLTAKSVARYNKIAEDKKFAEYYLLGTLTSTLYAVLAYFVIFRLF